MQPYLFPYIGYFQLINAVDKFIVYDNVAFIKQGWINRNNILLNGTPFLFTIPLLNLSSFAPINQTYISYKTGWKKNFIKTIQHAYLKAPYYEPVKSLLDDLFMKDELTISALATNSIKQISSYLGIDTIIKETTTGYQNSHLNGQERVLDICKKEGAEYYINAIGGMELYKKTDFKDMGIDLNFIKHRPVQYKQFNNEFVPHLSIIDVMMFNSVEKIKDMLNEYELE